MRSKVKGLQLGIDVVWRQGILMDILDSSFFYNPGSETLNVQDYCDPKEVGNFMGVVIRREHGVISYVPYNSAAGFIPEIFLQQQVT